MILIAHRLSTVEDCDMVLVMDRGEIVDVGRPQELAARPGIYRDLYLQQRGDLS